MNENKDTDMHIIDIHIDESSRPSTIKDYEVVDMYCQHCGDVIPSPSSFRDANCLRIFFMTGRCQHCQDMHEE